MFNNTKEFTMNKFTLSLILTALLVVVGCDNVDGVGGNTDSPLGLVLHNQGEDCLTCHDASQARLFTSGATVYTNLDSIDSYADGYTIRLVLENTQTLIDYIPKYGTGNSHTPYEESINTFTAKVLDANANVVNSSEQNSHDSSQLNCNSCHTAEGTSGAPGRITSNMTSTQTVSISSVSSDEKSEGISLVHTVQMSGVSTKNQNYAFALGGGTADTATDYAAAVFSNGVIHNTDGTITVPANVTSFTITIATNDDALKEGAESYNLSVGAKTTSGTILDNDTVSVATVSSIATYEGADLVHEIKMSGASTSDENYTFTLGGGTVNYPNDYLDAQLSDNVINNADGSITVPAGVSAFTITITTNDDTQVEDTETYNLAVGGINAVGTILDNDTAATVSVSSISSDEKVEGTALVHTLQMSGVSTSNQNYFFTLEGVTATYTSDYSAAIFSNNVINNMNGTITVPAGLSTFTVTVPTSNDTLDEDLETYNLSVAEVTAVGSIADNDTASVLSVSSPTQTEGTSLVHTVQMSCAAASNKNYTYTLHGDSSDYLAAIFSNNVLNNGNGTITVPASVTSFTITIPTINDTLIEDTETYNITVGEISAFGTILDNDTVVTTVSFTNDVYPILYADCYSCHKPTKNRTFQVDTIASTYSNIITNSLISTTNVDSSLLLVKPSGGLSHDTIFSTTSTEYKTLRDWVTEGGLNN